MKRVVFFFLIFHSILSANRMVFDTPTAISLEKAEYELFGSFYGGGGMLVKLGVGINRYINLGATEYIDGLIGSGRNEWGIPNIFLKLRVTDRAVDSFNFAFGYDTFYNGSFSPFSKKIYGLYGVYSLGFNFLSEYLAGPHLFSVGVRYPLIFERGDVNVFTSLILPLTDFLEVSTEVSNLHFGKQYRYFFIQSNKLVFRVIEALAISFIFQVALEKEVRLGGEKREDLWRFSRNLEIVYHDFF